MAKKKCFVIDKDGNFYIIDVLLRKLFMSLFDNKKETKKAFGRFKISGSPLDYCFEELCKRKIK